MCDLSNKKISFTQYNFLLILLFQIYEGTLEKPSLLNRMPCVPYVPKCQKRANVLFLRANVPINVSMCRRRAKGVPVFQAGLPTWQKRAIFFNIACQKVCQLLNYFSKELYFLYAKYIYA